MVKGTCHVRTLQPLSFDLGIFAGIVNRHSYSVKMSIELAMEQPFDDDARLGVNQDILSFRTCPSVPMSSANNHRGYVS